VGSTLTLGASAHITRCGSYPYWFVKVRSRRSRWLFRTASALFRATSCRPSKSRTQRSSYPTILRANPCSLLVLYARQQRPPARLRRHLSHSRSRTVALT